MYKRILSTITIAAIIAMTIPSAVFAANLSNLSISKSPFDPSKGESTSISFNSDASGFYSLEVLNSSNSVVRTLVDNGPMSNGTNTAVWNGRNDSNNFVEAGNYKVKLQEENSSGDPIGSALEKSVTVEIGTLAITKFTLNHTNSFDPAPDASDETLTVTYEINKAPDQVRFTVFDEYGDDLRTTTSSKQNDTFSWNGEVNNEIVEPGEYKVEIKVTKSGFTTVTESRTIEVEYSDSDKPEIDDFEVKPEEFDPDFNNATILFAVKDRADIILEVRDDDGDVVQKYSKYDGKNYGGSSTIRSENWSGKKDNGDNWPIGDYEVVLLARNDSGVSKETATVSINNEGGTLPDSNGHIDDLRIPSVFEPAEDDEMLIRFDIEEELEKIEVVATKGTKGTSNYQEYEIYDDNNVEKENDFAVYWDGTDDDNDYVDEGTWTIRIRTTEEVDNNNSFTLEAGDIVEVRYDSPGIDDLYLSKDEFDPDEGETTFIIFKVDFDAEVDLYVYKDDEEDDEIITEWEVAGDEWYAYEWDGGSYDEDDEDLEIRLVARNVTNEEIFNSDSVDVEIDEDEVSKSKANVTEDKLLSVISKSTEDKQISYYLDDDAEVTISIHKGPNGSGTSIIDLLDEEEQDSGFHTITWDGRDDDGDKLTGSQEVYSYKITAKTSSTETERGLFIIGSVGEIDGDTYGDGGRNDDDDDDDDGRVIIIDGVPRNVDDDDKGNDDDCGSFQDVNKNSKYCEAIGWAEEEGIFQGYFDGTFRPYSPISRVEMLKVALEANDISIRSAFGTTLGFSDVDPNAWYISYINTGRSLGIFNGDSGKSTARPNEPVNRAEALKLMLEAVESASSYRVGICGVSPYFDVQVNAWYAPYVCVSEQYNLFETNSNYFGAGNYATRAEVALALYNLDQEGLL